MPLSSLYEIHTWTWLASLSRRHGHRITLHGVPSEEWDALAEWHVDAVWLMGVWQRSPAAHALAVRHPQLAESCRRVVPDCEAADIAGSPYSIHGYYVDARLGGAGGLAAARAQLAERGIALLLDFVPNHVAIDHPWVTHRPELLVHGQAADAQRFPGRFFAAEGRLVAHGRDPSFPSWTDTAQVDAFRPAVRQAAIATLCDMARHCDGVRCDMAMLLLTRVFRATWGDLVGPPPSAEYWTEVIAEVRRSRADFVFLAESYGDTEGELLQQGFDFCYDKTLYDRLLHDEPESVRRHLAAEPAFQRRLVRFLENHDEPRAATLFDGERARAAAVATFTLPGVRLFHEGQFEGSRAHIPVQLARRPVEAVDHHVRAFYRQLLTEIAEPVMRTGEWRLCRSSGWPDNASWKNVLAWCWRLGGERRLIVVNLSAEPSQARIGAPWDDLAGKTWQFHDRLSGARYVRDGEELAGVGLYVGLPAYGVHFFALSGLDGSAGSTAA